jgi:hypothetical protein
MGNDRDQTADPPALGDEFRDGFWLTWDVRGIKRAATLRECADEIARLKIRRKRRSMTDNQTALLPCPFCGSAAEFVYDERSDDWTVQCTSCVGEYHETTREAAAEGWNRRVVS